MGVVEGRGRLFRENRNFATAGSGAGIAAEVGTFCDGRGENEVFKSGSDLTEVTGFIEGAAIIRGRAVVFEEGGRGGKEEE
jgi:hypothetical protein